MPAITDLWLSGGEPTLRHDASEIIDLFVRNNGVERLIIPTNGLVKSRVYEIVNRALSTHNELDLYLNIALDGQGATHDLIRGVPGHWEKTLDCIEELYPLKEKFKDRFRLNVNTVVCAVWASQLRESFASLRDYDYDFGALWSAGSHQRELAAIDGGNACWCTHVCFIHDSMRHARRALLYEAPKNYLTRGSW